jgi:hypothetical protein
MIAMMTVVMIGTAMEADLVEMIEPTKEAKVAILVGQVKTLNRTKTEAIVKNQVKVVAIVNQVKVVAIVNRVKVVAIVNRVKAVVAKFSKTLVAKKLGKFGQSLGML